jgi:hypothetical protein
MTCLHEIIIQIWMWLTGRAKFRIIAIPNPKRMKRCPRCIHYSVIFASPCPICGCTGEAEYEWKKNHQR